MRCSASPARAARSNGWQRGDCESTSPSVIIRSVNSRRSHVTKASGTSNAVATTTNTFDTANRLSSITHASGGSTLASYEFTYDAMSRIASIDSSVEGLSEFSYDAASQLIGADHTSQSDESYSFDGNGNRTSSGYSTGTQTIARRKALATRTPIMTKAIASAELPRRWQLSGVPMGLSQPSDEGDTARCRSPVSCGQWNMIRCHE